LAEHSRRPDQAERRAAECDASRPPRGGVHRPSLSGRFVRFHVFSSQTRLDVGPSHVFHVISRELADVGLGCRLKLGTKLGRNFPTGGGKGLEHVRRNNRATRANRMTSRIDQDTNVHGGIVIGRGGGKQRHRTIETAGNASATGRKPTIHLGRLARQSGTHAQSGRARRAISIQNGTSDSPLLGADQMPSGALARSTGWPRPVASTIARRYDQPDVDHRLDLGGSASGSIRSVRH
jgi:hypothetical protein